MPDAGDDRLWVVLRYDVFQPPDSREKNVTVKAIVFTRAEADEMCARLNTLNEGKAVYFRRVGRGPASRRD